MLWVVILVALVLVVVLALVALYNRLVRFPTASTTHGPRSTSS